MPCQLLAVCWYSLAWPDWLAEALGPILSLLLLRSSLQVRCYDWDSDGSHDFIGEFPTTLAEFIDAYQNKKQVGLV